MPRREYFIKTLLTGITVVCDRREDLNFQHQLLAIGTPPMHVPCVRPPSIRQIRSVHCHRQCMFIMSRFDAVMYATTSR